MANLINERPISKVVFNPENALFKETRNSRASCTVIWCKLADCPLLASGACMWRPPLGWTRCPYGRVATEEGPTKRAQSCGDWIRNRQELHPGVGDVGYPAKRMALVGDYVYLPYVHADMNKSVPFLEHSGVFTSGTFLISREFWTLETVLAILDFRPQAMMGGEITSYQKDEVPLFLLHLRETDATMWAALIAVRPELDTVPNHVGRKALLRTLTPPIKWVSNHKYPVVWRWDGEFVVTTSKDAYSSTWGNLKLESLELRARPETNAVVVVRDNAWVNENTEFVD